jgi:hypothetical protein
MRWTRPHGYYESNSRIGDQKGRGEEIENPSRLAFVMPSSLVRGSLRSESNAGIRFLAVIKAHGRCITNIQVNFVFIEFYLRELIHVLDSDSFNNAGAGLLESFGAEALKSNT